MTVDQSLFDAAGLQIGDTNTLLAQALDQLAAGNADGAKTLVLAAVGSNIRSGLKVDALAHENAKPVAKAQSAPVDPVPAGGESWNQWVGPVPIDGLGNDDICFMVDVMSDPRYGPFFWLDKVGGTEDQVKAALTRGQQVGRATYKQDFYFAKRKQSPVYKMYVAAGGFVPA